MIFQVVEEVWRLQLMATFIVKMDRAWEIRRFTVFPSQQVAALLIQVFHPNTQTSYFLPLFLTPKFKRAATPPYSISKTHVESACFYSIHFCHLGHSTATHWDVLVVYELIPLFPLWPILQSSFHKVARVMMPLSQFKLFKVLLG